MSRACAPLLRAVLLALSACQSASWVEWSATAAGPGERAGHSLLIFNDTLFLFGGRGPAATRLHDPRTFSTQRSETGTVEFSKYNDKHVTACLDAAGDAVDDATSPEYAACYSIDVLTYRNDLWAYSLNCSRLGDQPCVPGSVAGPSGSPVNWTHGGWRLVLGGAPLGGCINYNETQSCTHPAERVDHAAAVLTETPPVRNEQTGLWSLPPAQIVVYGGYAQACGDYCSDMWAFPITACNYDAAKCFWREVGVLGRRGPGKRRKPAFGSDKTRLVVFGGYRLWHGFAPENSEKNEWDVVAPGDSNAASTAQQYGGFLDDMWVFIWDTAGVWQTAYNGTTNAKYGQATFGGAEPVTRELTLGPVIQPDECAGQDCSFKGSWQQVIPREDCHHTPGISFENRNDVTCTISWPRAREGAALAMRAEDLFLHGGHASAILPYPHVFSSGSGPGVSALKSDSPSLAGIYPFEVSRPREGLARARAAEIIAHRLPPNRPLFPCPSPSPYAVVVDHLF